MRTSDRSNEIIEFANDANLEVTEISSNSNGYPEGLDSWAITGFATIEEADEFANLHGLEVCGFTQRAGSQFKYNRGRAYQAYSVNDQMDKFGDNYQLIDQEWLEDVEDEDKETEKYKELVKEVANCPEGQAVIANCHDYYENFYDKAMQFTADVTTYSIGVCLPKDLKDDEENED